MNYESMFSHDIERMLKFRDTVGLSLKSYNSYMKFFDFFCKTERPHDDTLSQDLIFDWLKYEISNGRSGMRVKIIAMRYFAKYLNAMGKPSYVIPKRMAPAITQYSPYCLSDIELKKLFQAIDTLSTTKWSSWALATFPVLFRLMYTCGLRPGEALYIKCKNVNFETGEINILCSKKYRDRIVLMSRDMLIMCNEYKKQRDVLFPLNDFLFPLNANEPFNRYSVANYFTECWRHVNRNVPRNQIPRLRPYDLRHHFASRILHAWYADGRNIYSLLPSLKAHMGHLRIKSTLYYVHLLPDVLVKNNNIDWKTLNEIIPEIENEKN